MVMCDMSSIDTSCGGISSTDDLAAGFEAAFLFGAMVGYRWDGRKRCGQLMERDKLWRTKHKDKNDINVNGNNDKATTTVR